MRVLVIGAAGRTGRQVVEQALGHGHRVRAMVRSSEMPISHERLETVTGDVLDFDAVSAAVEGMDAVAVTLGSGGTDAQVHSGGIANVIYAMALHQVDKLVAVSAAGVFARTDPKLSLRFRALIATAHKAVYDDLEAMEQRIAASGLGWTIVRPFGLTDGPMTGGYRFTRDGSLLAKAARVSRADVAALVLKAIETDEYERRTLVIAG